MKKKLPALIALLFALSMVLTACGASKEASSEAKKEKTVKNTATATMDEGAFPVDVTVDVSSGLSVVFSSDGFLLFDFMMSFEKSIDGDRADEITGYLDFNY